MTAMKRTIWKVLVCSIALVGLVILGLPAIQAFRAANRMTVSVNNLKQIGCGLQNYDDAFGAAPLGADTGADRMLHHGWQVRVLPFTESLTFYPVDFNYAWDDPFNAPFFRHRCPIWLVPGITQVTDERGFALSHYAGNSHVFGVDRCISLGKIPNGGSNTILVGETADGFVPWGQPGNWRDPVAGLDGGRTTFGSSRHSGIPFVMCDGSVRIVDRKIDPAVLRALAAPADDERPDGN